VEEVFRGRTDVELNQTGIKQAELLAEYLSKRKIGAMYSSPLKRAVKTAEIIAGYHGLEIKVAPGLIDFDCGDWHGLLRQEVQDKYKELYDLWVSHPDKVKIPGGESLNEVTERAMNVLDDVIAKHEGTVVLLAHRVVNKVLICALLGLDNSHFWNIRQDICGITTFVYEDGQFILTEHNNTSFLTRHAPLSDF
jgi:probable phosphoglycerate mutase